MVSRTRFRLTAALFAGVSFGAMTGLTVTLAPSPAAAQTTEDFRVALESYGFWQPHPRFGEVWVPFGKPRSWRPYTAGRWVYTEEWGWYWASDPDEEAWGWIAFHYGRWIYDRRLGWAWVPGEEWAPAWVNWRRSDDIVGWAPAPPEDVIYEFDDDPEYWTFVEPRYLVAPRVRTFFIPAPRAAFFLRRSVLVNRAFVHGGGGRFAVNPGISPAFIAARSGRPLDTFRVLPRVLAGTAGVAGSIAIQAAQNRSPGGPARRGGPPGAARPAPSLPPVTIQRAAAVQPQAVQPPQPLGRERGRLGNFPPRAAQGGAPGGAAPGGAAPAPAPQAAPAAPAQAPVVVPPAGAPAPGVTPVQPLYRSRPFGPGNRPPPPSSAPAAPQVAPPSSPPPAAAPSPPPAAAPRPSQPPPQMRPPRVERPRAPPPQRPSPPQARPSPPPAAVRPPPQARPAPPQARPAPPPQARPAPPPPRPAAPPPAKKPPPKPGEKPQ